MLKEKGNLYLNSDSTETAQKKEIEQGMTKLLAELDSLCSFNFT